MVVLVMGAGVGGLSTAIALRKAGHDVVVAEGSSSLPTDGFSITIPSNGVRALHELGVADSIISQSTTIDRFEFAWQNNVFISEALDSARFEGYPWIALHRSLLVAKLAEQAGPIRFGITVTKICERADHVEVTFEDGDQENFDLVVGADGVNSTARSVVCDRCVPEWAGVLYYRAMLPDAEREPVIRIHIGDQCAFSVFPGGPGQIYGWAGLPCRRGNSRLSDRASPPFWRSVLQALEKSRASS